MGVPQFLSGELLPDSSSSKVITCRAAGSAAERSGGGRRTARRSGLGWGPGHPGGVALIGPAYGCRPPDDDGTPASK
ncbi:hypothetical protein PH213_42900 [Streptomyces sp. SRF1]|uniref:hypothetical protein n=1 Tax=Streptomyces sp. SRF1 TaxID=1549642 RepID=UPI000A5DB29F|nr:hypothetical protein [Streptomyces sp. SRF1]MDN3061129.1 hypothetical protein [Streptomyces sp. SRF1]